MNRTEARALWLRVAAGDLEHLEHLEQFDLVDLHAWMRQVAKQLLEADGEPDAKRRPGRILTAVGLRGKVDRYAGLRELVNAPQWDFPLLGEDGVAEETRAQIVRQMVAQAREKGLLNGIYADDDKEAVYLVGAILGKKI